MRKGEEARDEMAKDVNGRILRDGVEVRRRWAEYFEQVLNEDKCKRRLADASVGRIECKNNIDRGSKRGSE